MFRRNLNVDGERLGRARCATSEASGFRRTLALSHHWLHTPLAVVVLLTMRLPSNDAAPGPDTLLSSPQVMSTELLQPTRSPRAPQSPSIPPRNPLRQRATAVRNDDHPPSPVIPALQMQIVHSQSLPPLTAVDSDEAINVDKKALGKSLSESPIMMPLSFLDLDDSDSSTASSPTLIDPVSSSPTMSKRNHALFELLSSERSYSSDLALIRDVHIPLALGE